MQTPPPSSFMHFEREKRYVQLLLEAGELLTSALNWHETTQAVCTAAVRHMADICLLDVGKGDQLELVTAAHRDPARTKFLQGAGAFLYGKRIKHPVLLAVEKGQATLIPDLGERYIAAQSTSEEHERFMREMHYRSLMVVPLITKTQGTIGALTFVRTIDSTEQYDEEALRFAKDLASRCAMAIAKAQLYEQNRNISTHFQKAALPTRLPHCEGISFDSYYEPSSEEMLVGGDWFDAFTLRDGRVAVTIGDVLGHGVEAAVWMSKLRNGLRAALLAEPVATRALGIADELLRQESDEDFTTAIVALIDPVRRTLSCASAGHPGPLIWERSGSVTDPFAERGLPLGLRDLGPVAQTAQTLDVAEGTFITFFTDGLLEWNRNIAAAWNELHAAIQRREVRESKRPAREIRNAVIDASRHQDDIAILTVRWHS